MEFSWHLRSLIGAVNCNSQNQAQVADALETILNTNNKLLLAFLWTEKYSALNASTFKKMGFDDFYIYRLLYPFPDIEFIRQCVFFVEKKADDDKVHEQGDLIWAQYHMQQMWDEYLIQIESLIKQYLPLDQNLFRYIINRLLFPFDVETQASIKTTLDKYLHVLEYMSDGRIKYSEKHYTYVAIPPQPIYPKIYQVFQQDLTPIDFAVDLIPGVGNCFPESLRCQLRDLPEFSRNPKLLTHESQREMVIQYMKVHKNTMIKHTIPIWIQAYRSNENSHEWKFVEPFLKLANCETVYDAMMHNNIFANSEFYFEEAMIIFLLNVLESPVHLNRKLILVVIDDHRDRNAVVLSTQQVFHNDSTPLVTYVYRTNDNHYQSISVRGKRHFELNDKMSLLAPKILQLINDKIQK